LHNTQIKLTIVVAIRRGEEERKIVPGALFSAEEKIMVVKITVGGEKRGKGTTRLWTIRAAIKPHPRPNTRGAKLVTR